MSIKDGGPAFPVAGGIVQSPYSHTPHYSIPQVGMSTRDYFAGQALSGLIVADPKSKRGEDGDEARARLSRAAYGLADAMLAERAKQESADD